MINKETIQLIHETARIEEVVGEFVTLKKKGVNYLGQCPFHNEKTPSFTVSPVKGIFKCFGCGKAGTSVGFIMEHEHFNYPEALKWLAKKYGIPVEEKVQTADELQALGEQESMFNLTAFAAKYFADYMWTDEKGKAIGLEYFRERGYTDETIRKFQLGFSSEDPESFTKHAVSSGYNLEYLLKTGLSIQGERRPYDRFHSRVIFPIHNLSGRSIGFGGRILSSDKSKAKYLNSPESEIYSKSKVLYGLFYAKNAIVKNDTCFLVEGYTDVISLHQAGIENVVSSSGTSLTIDQIKLIKRYTPNITILYDGDPAGIKASFRGIDMILEEGMNVKVVLFPEGEDPDSFFRNKRTSEAKAFIEKNATNFITLKTRLLQSEAERDPIKRASLIRDIVTTISLIPDAIYRTIYIKECSSILEIGEQTLMNELNKILRKKYSDKYYSSNVSIANAEFEIPAKIELIEEDNLDLLEQNVIRLLLNYGQFEIKLEKKEEETETGRRKRKVENTITLNLALFVISDFMRDGIEFSNPVYQKAFDEYKTNMQNDIIPDEKFFINHADPEISQLAVDALSSNYILSINWFDQHHIHVPAENEQTILTKAVLSSTYALKAKRLERLIYKKSKILKVSHSNDIMPLMLELKVLKEQYNSINKALGRTIIR